jgi:hypothetical protein
MTIVKRGDTGGWGGGGQRGAVRALAQLAAAIEGGRMGAFLAWPTTAASLQIKMEIHISDWTHKFQNKTGLDAKANLELYKSNRVNSASVLHSPVKIFRPTRKNSGTQFQKVLC